VPVRFTPDLIPRYDSTFLRYINENFQKLKQALLQVPVETISTVAPGSPYAGQTYTNTVLGITYVYNGSVWVPFKHWGPGTTFTPTWTQGGAITKTTNAITQYFQEGKTVWGSVYMSATGGAGVANTAQTVGLPVAANAAGFQEVGSGHFFDASAGLNYPFLVVLASTTTFQFITTGAPSGVLLGQTGSDNNAAVVNTDGIFFNFRYVTP
jgi:hypothetical protein